MAVSIEGIGAVLAPGNGVDGLRAALIENRDKTGYTVSLEGLEQFISPRKSRRMDRLTRMVVLGANLAVKDAGIEVDEDFKNSTGIVFGTALGPQCSTFLCLDGIIEDGDNCLSSLAFTSSVHNTPVTQVSLHMGICGPVRTVTTLGYTVGGTLGTALNWLGENIVKQVIVILGEDLSPVLNYAVQGLQGNNTGSGPVSPFSSGCTYGGAEGCVAFLLKNGGRGYCDIAAVDISAAVGEAAKSAASCDMLFCAAAGNSDEYETYRQVWAGAPLVGAYSSLYGSFFTGMAAELAIAALSIKDKRTYRVPGDMNIENLRLPDGNPLTLNKVGVAAVAARDRVTFARLERR